MAESIFFYIFAAISLTGALIVVTHRNPVVGAVSLVLTLFGTAALFILLQAHFIAAVQILLYAGAVIVLILFTVMFLNIRPGDLRFDSFSIPKSLTLLSFLLLVVGYLAYSGSVRVFGDSPEAVVDDSFGTVEHVGTTLFTDYILQFELTGILIVAAIIGVVVIAKKGDF